MKGEREGALKVPSSSTFLSRSNTHVPAPFCSSSPLGSCSCVGHALSISLVTFPATTPHHVRLIHTHALLSPSTLLSLTLSPSLSFPSSPPPAPGLFSPPDVNVSRIPALPYPASPPWVATATIKYINCSKADPASLSTGKGHYDFSLIDMREDAVFWMFTGGIAAPTPLARCVARQSQAVAMAAPCVSHRPLPELLQVKAHHLQGQGSSA